MNALDLSADIGLVAVGLATANLLLGLLLALRYSPVRQWPHRRINYFRLHNWTGYLAMAAVILHPAVLLFSSTARFRLIDVFYPVHSPSQPLENTIGAIGFYLVLIVVVTSYFRLRMGRRTWKAFHFVIYAAAAALFWHSIFTDPLLKNTPLDPLDGEKAFVEICLMLVVLVAMIRWRRAVRKAMQSEASAAPASLRDSGPV
ncbi:MAG TPA: ferric reductase-like transmembrane domain-containing protein [Candidatus Acidoferrales bacterium]|nr:ferric reductase-like transmembrane domain-containing protein [Candidatus Acidoferrales bacterium]